MAKFQILSKDTSQLLWNVPIGYSVLLSHKRYPDFRLSFKFKHWSGRNQADTRHGKRVTLVGRRLILRKFLVGDTLDAFSPLLRQLNGFKLEISKVSEWIYLATSQHQTENTHTNKFKQENKMWKKEAADLTSFTPTEPQSMTEHLLEKMNRSNRQEFPLKEVRAAF